MFKRSWIVAAVVAGLAGAVAWACGPMFPNQLLDHRGDTLKAVPQNSFAFEATHLLVATDKLAVEEPSLYDDGGQHKDDAAQAKSLGISIAQLGRVDTLRALDDGDAAYAQGSDLPEDLRAYTAGAVDYAKGHEDKASLRFEQVLALPPAQATLRGVWAAYMLGRIHAANAASASNDATAFSRERAAAAKAFQLTRTRAVEGALDSQGLAVSSFGEEARLYLYGHGTQCSWNDLYGVADANNSEDGDATHTQGANAACGDGVPAADLKRAITLYAAQAGHGSNVGVQSLVAIADYAMRHPQRMAELIDNPVSQRLLVAYALARMGGSSEETPAGSAPKPDQPLLALVQAIEQRGMDKLEGADRLAALAYQTGRYELAAKLVDKSSGPLAEWVRAKLALQKGDLAAASASYAAAVKAFPKAGDAQAAIEPSNANLITGEQGVLALARGEYVEAMGHLYDAAVAVGGDGNVYDWDLETTSYGYGNDAMYIAERVLTVDELKSFVDARAPATPLTSKSPSSDDAYRYRSPIADSLRWVLARRLMRLGRYGDALPYFPADNDWRFGTYGDDGKLQVQSFRTPALSYAKALHDSEHAWTDIGKAQALYAAAVIAREHGMQILGYEQGPDYTDSEGSYQGGSGQTPQSLQQAYVTEGERQRYAASEAKPNYRFHYRYIAADQANRAADLLPPRSQAFAAVLCQATGWMMEGPPDYEDHYQGYGEPAPSEPSERLRRVKAYYQRYVKQGAYVEWAGGFGTGCEVPDFDRARALKRSEQVAAIKHAVRHGWPLELGAVLVLMGGLVAWIARRRRRKTPA
ncbi:hypothetical protein [Dyella kyungheensis]|uniref:Tetratricopeptide repeat protein n=1 Tax=Dyella kyungheensis TaxID=1242174 RepID=A0ABS2JP88_9GAMM|nr:hypothetical protein [Dyella kyungheensis]MBM7120650.1 hypothetical protein [Dyella kyungheensis]